MSATQIYRRLLFPLSFATFEFFSPVRKKENVLSCTHGYRKLSSTSGVSEEPSKASLSLVSSSRSSSGRVSAVSCDMESVSSSSAARELTAKKTD